jgi:SAM-dependent methyltransferase
MGSTHRRFDVEQSLAYIDLVFEEYLTYGELSSGALDGARVLELGPGDSLGVALRFVAAGASSVICVDRFVTRRDPEQQRTIYRALAERGTAPERERISSAIDVDTGSIREGGPLRLSEGLPIERAPAALGSGAFDLIVSRAVLEHVVGLDSAFDAMAELLAPGGRLVHEVDLRDHDLFPGQHPLTFLTVSDRTYRWMGAASGLPNRLLVDHYRDALGDRGFEPSILVTHVIGEPEAATGPRTRVRDAAEVEAAGPLADEIRPRLLSRYRELSAGDLAVSGIFLSASRG